MEKMKWRLFDCWKPKNSEICFATCATVPTYYKKKWQGFFLFFHPNQNFTEKKNQAEEDEKNSIMGRVKKLPQAGWRAREVFSCTLGKQWKALQNNVCRYRSCAT